MKLGFFTVCLGSMPIEDKIRYAAANGFNAVEIGCWPKVNGRDYSCCDIDVDTLTPEKARELRGLADSLGIEISSIGYYDNNLAADADVRKHINAHTRKVITAARMLGVPLAGTFIGRNHLATIEENLDQYEAVFKPLVSFAEDNGVKLMFENCPMTGWQVRGLPGTISFSPELWQELFRRIPSPSFGLNYDPSHLNFMMMDCVSPVKEFSDRIFHVHAKDSAVDSQALKRYGVFNRQLDSSAGGIWKFSMPGRGTVDFDGLYSALNEIGYNGTVSIEHEDPEFSGSTEKVILGLETARDFLSRYYK